MAKGEFHIGPNGPGSCDADPSKPNSTGCPYGGSSGSENHFKTMGEAEGYYAETMEAEHGLFNTAPADRTPQQSTLSPFLQRKYKKTFEALAANKAYGLSRGLRDDYIADDSEGLRRFANELEEQGDGHLSIDIEYEPDTDDEVIRSINIPELKIEIENQNSDEDASEFFEYRDDSRQTGQYYWSSTQ